MNEAARPFLSYVLRPQKTEGDRPQVVGMVARERLHKCGINKPGNGSFDFPLGQWA